MIANAMRAILLASATATSLKDFFSISFFAQDRSGSISKRGNKYLRKLLIHGARAALPHVAERDTALGRWAKGLLSRVHRNVAVVAFANKLARIAWAVLRRGEPFAVKGLPLTA